MASAVIRARTIGSLWMLLTLDALSSLYIYYLNSSSGFTFYMGSLF